MTRKIIQFTTPPDGTTVALCDDGSLWFLPSGEDAEWHVMADIPQDVASSSDRAMLWAKVEARITELSSIPTGSNSSLMDSAISCIVCAKKQPNKVDTAHDLITAMAACVMVLEQSAGESP